VTVPERGTNLTADRRPPTADRIERVGRRGETGIERAGTNPGFSYQEFGGG
jgi:hypothetical protein